MAERLFVFTAGSQQAYEHYIDTIENGFTLESIKQFLTEKMIRALEAIYGNENLRAWGALPGSQNIRNWESMKVSDRVLIYSMGTMNTMQEFLLKLITKNWLNIFGGRTNTKIMKKHGSIFIF